MAKCNNKVKSHQKSTYIHPCINSIYWRTQTHTQAHTHTHIHTSMHMLCLWLKNDYAANNNNKSGDVMCCACTGRNLCHSGCPPTITTALNATNVHFPTKQNLFIYFFLFVWIGHYCSQFGDCAKMEDTKNVPLGAALKKYTTCCCYVCDQRLLWAHIVVVDFLFFFLFCEKENLLLDRLQWLRPLTASHGVAINVLIAAAATCDRCLLQLHPRISARWFCCCLSIYLRFDVSSFCIQFIQYDYFLPGVIEKKPKFGGEK